MRARARFRSLSSRGRSRLGDLLDALASELRCEDAGLAEALHEEVARLILAAGHWVLRTGSSAAESLLEPAACEGAAHRPLFGILLERLRPADAGLLAVGEPFELLSREEPSDGWVRELLGCMAELARAAGNDAGGAVRELGALHEALLRTRLVRLEHEARRARLGERGWISAVSLLAWEPGLRAKRLAGELGLSKHDLDRLNEPLGQARSKLDVEQCLEAAGVIGSARCESGRWVIQPSHGQRRSGAHYTPWPLCVTLVERTLGPLIAALPEPKSQALLRLKVCDPAMGAGAFLLAAAHHLAGELVAAWRREGVRHEHASEEHARRLVVSSVLRGVDKSPAAVSLSRMTLALFACPPGAPPLCLDGVLARGDALLGRAAQDGQNQHGQNDASRLVPPGDCFDWPTAFPDVFSRPDPGFDALIGNPPWVAYVGRAAQPLDPALAAYHAATNPAFKRYRTLHGLFVYRAAVLLRSGGRLGLVLPTSVADLDGYEATRTAHDRLCEVDACLPDWGDGAFDGVFQPAMALLSTRRKAAAPAPAPRPWPLAGAELPEVERALLDRLAALPRLPAELFGERGFQTTSDDRAQLRRAAAPEPPFCVALREGSDVAEFCALPPTLFAAPERLAGRLRPRSDWERVRLLIRQTARFPIAALADGVAFRNSILAGFETREWPAPLLLCLLNSSLVRWLHFTRHRDARQGMPQLKIGHLRSLPAPPERTPALLEALRSLGATLGARAVPPSKEERLELDELVADAFALNARERQAVLAWGEAHPAPSQRRRREAPAHRPAGLPAP